MIERGRYGSSGAPGLTVLTGEEVALLVPDLSVLLKETSGDIPDAETTLEPSAGGWVANVDRVVSHALVAKNVAQDSG